MPTFRDHVLRARRDAGAAGWMLAIAAASTGCAPGAFVNFETPRLSFVNSTGAVGAECSETSWDRTPRVRFTLQDSDQRPIMPGTELGGFTLRLNETFSARDVSVIGNGGRLFPAPDVPCAAGSEGQACPVAELAAAGFVCGPLDNAQSTTDGSLVCTKDVPVQVNPNATLRFTGGEERTAVIALVSNGASVFGQNAETDAFQESCSTDRLDRRTRGFVSMLRQLRESVASDAVVDARICVASFDAASEPTYRVPEGDTVSDCFFKVDDPFPESELPRIGNQEKAGAGRNPWAAIIDASRRFDEWLPGAGWDKHIVVFTDGDLSEDVAVAARAQGLTAARALTEAVTAGVTVHIVQLDRVDRADDCFPASVNGAIDDFARLACATGGSYSLVQRADDIPVLLENVGRAVPGFYEVDLLFDELAALPLGPYTLETAMEFRVDRDAKTYIFAGRAGAGLGRSDTRISVFNRGDCAGDRSCYAGYECRADAVCAPPEPVP